MRSLSRVLRLATVLSATPSSSSSPLARYESSSAGDMSATLAKTAAAATVAPRAAALSRAHLVRRRPGFVRSAISTSTSRWATTRLAAHSSSHASSSSQLVTRPEVGRHGGLHNLQREASYPASRGTIALEGWFTPRRRSLGRLSQQRLFSTESPSATVDTDHISSPDVRTPHSTGEGGGGRGNAGAETALREDVGDVEAGGEREGGEGGGGAAPFKVNLLEMDDGEVEDFLKGMGEPKYRAKQVLKWMYEGGAATFDDMNNIPKALRAKLSEVATVGVLEIAAKQTSKDGTKKLAYRLSDGQLIESVLMPYSDGRRTACISSQAGCAMGCVFCATGQMGFKRQLSSAEIFEQAYHFSQELNARGDRLSNVVFMGMGEPLANYKNVMEAVRRINTELGIGARHITISTVGLVPRILRLSQEDIQVKLAVSLHAANDRERSALLPVNRRFPLSELMDACREYVDASGRRMTFEWALIQGENDSAEVASELGRLLRPLKGMCHVNIIPLNPTAGYKGGPSMADAVNQFVEVLARNGVPATPRIRRGIDIDAGCGQLTVKVAQDDVLGKGI